MSKYDRLWRFLLPVLLIVVVGVYPLLTGRDADRELVFTLLRAVALAASLNIILGFTGYVSFGHVVFFGLGGYTTLYLVIKHGWPLWPAILMGGLAAVSLALLVGGGILRLRGAYFALVTIGVNEAIKAFVYNFQPFGGPIGLELNFQVIRAYGGPARVLWDTYYALWAVTLTVVALSFWIRSSKFGLGLLSIREDEDAAEVMGVPTTLYKNLAFLLSAFFPGLVGGLFFFRNSSIQPSEAFPLHISVESIVMVMLGGQGTVIGPVVGGLGYQWMRSFLLTNPTLKNIQLAVAGFLLLVIVLFIPAGLVGWLRRRFPALRRVLI